MARERGRRGPVGSPGGKRTSGAARPSTRGADTARHPVRVDSTVRPSRRRVPEPLPERRIFGLSTARIVLLAAVVGVLALTLAVPLRTYYAQKADMARLAAEHRELERDVAALRDKRTQQQDPAYIRAEARSRLRLVDPGETPYIVQLPGAYEASLPAPRALPKPTGPWFSKLWQEAKQPRPTTIAPEPLPPMPVEQPDKPRSPQPEGQTR
ncbi:MAG: septum formation initiator family protein [Streptomycetaceae bacterium]|nr:septum formation initiator family protein [Streptomycetaceae bacterium]